MKREYFIIISLLIIIFIILEVKKSHMSIKESFLWIVLSFCTLFLSLFPNIVNKCAKFFGVSYPPSILFVFVLLFLMFIIFRNSKIQAFQQEKITDLTQQIAILKEKLNNEKNKKGRDTTNNS